MGNNLAYDTRPPALDDLLQGRVEVADKRAPSVTRIRSKLFLWALNTSGGSVTYDPIPLRDFTFDAHTSYLMLHVIDTSRLNQQASKVSLSPILGPLLRSMLTAIDENSLIIPVTNAHSHKSQVLNFLYAWEGKQSSPVDRSIVVAKAWAVHGQLHKKGSMLRGLLKSPSSIPLVTALASDSTANSVDNARHIGVPEAVLKCPFFREAYGTQDEDRYYATRLAFHGQENKLHLYLGPGGGSGSSKTNAAAAAAARKNAPGREDTKGVRTAWSGADHASSASSSSSSVSDEQKRRGNNNTQQNGGRGGGAGGGDKENMDDDEYGDEPSTSSALNHSLSEPEAPRLPLSPRDSNSARLAGVDKEEVDDLIDKSDSVSDTAVSPKKQRQEKAKKLAMFADACSQITDFLFLAGAVPAQNYALLRTKGITHVVNAAGDVCDNYFEGKLTYLRLFTLDKPEEDLISILYDVIEFIEACRAAGGKVLVHCHQGVSRSCGLVIGYLMHANDINYDEACELVRARRAVCQPNVGFMFQLIAWRKRCVNGFTKPLLYRIAPHSTRDPNRLVAKAVPTVHHSSLDARGIFLLHCKERIWVWVGPKCVKLLECVEFAKKCVHRLQSYENGPAQVATVLKSPVPREFWDTLGGMPADEVAVNKEYDRDYIPVGSLSPHERKGSGIASPLACQPRLYQYPDYTPLDMFDADDLDDSQVYVLLLNPTAPIRVWVGDDFPVPRTFENRAGFAEYVGKQFAEKQLQLQQQQPSASLIPAVLRSSTSPVQVVYEAPGDESEEFWDGFVN